MKPRFTHIIFVIGISGWMISCGNSSAVNKTNSEKNIDSKKNQLTEKTDTTTNNQVVRDESKQEVIETTFDASSFVADTTLYLNKYHIIVGKEKYDVAKKPYTKEDLEFNPIIIYFTLTQTDSVVLKKTFEENEFAGITSFKNQVDNYLTLVSFGGGSGYVATVYKLEFPSLPNIIKVVSYTELSSPVFSTDGSELLLMNGIWDMSANGDEGHFSDHKYTISTVNLTNHKFTETVAGTTNGKYFSIDEDFSSAKLLKQIHQTEPLVFKGINLEKYSF